jgi:hypothetical protein
LSGRRTSSGTTSSSLHSLCSSSHTTVRSISLAAVRLRIRLASFGFRVQVQHVRGPACTCLSWQICKCGVCTAA